MFPVILHIHPWQPLPELEDLGALHATGQGSGGPLPVAEAGPAAGGRKPAPDIGAAAHYQPIAAQAITASEPRPLFPVETPSSHAPDTFIPDEPEVVALVERAVTARDQEAFGALYDLYLTRIYRYLYFRAGSQPDAEDLAELVFLKAWEAIDRFRWQGRPFVAWLYRLAHNVLVDHLRQRRPIVSLTDDEHPLDLPSEAAAGELARQLDADVLARAISQLTVEQQEVIVLKFIEGLDNVQIALSMDKREGAIRALQLRALLSLRRILQTSSQS